MTKPLTMREMADSCCKSCQSLKGDGPWCACCGVERPGAHVDCGDWFTWDLCPMCVSYMEEQP